MVQCKGFIYFFETLPALQNPSPHLQPPVLSNEPLPRSRASISKVVKATEIVLEREQSVTNTLLSTSKSNIPRFPHRTCQSLQRPSAQQHTAISQTRKTLQTECRPAGKLDSLNRSWQSKEGTYHALGVAGIEPTPSKSECDWTQLSP